MYKGDVPANVRRIVAAAGLCCLVVTLLSLSSIRPARANGRFPAAQAIETVPSRDDDTVFLRATFGILVSKDGGKRWRWICERAMGYEGTWDPPIAVTRDGRLWIGLERGLLSTLDGCTMDATPELARETIKDLTTDPDGRVVWALSGAPDRQGAVWRKPEAGKWERVGLVPAGVNPMTIEIAPSNPKRVYVSGQPFDTIRGWLLRSVDGGKTFTGGANDLAADGPFFIAAVDPKDDKRVLVRHLHTAGSDVLLTTDGGKTFTNVLTMKSAMYGFAKSRDGSTYYAGSGLPTDGIFSSTDRGASFQRVSSHGVLCLHATRAGGLFVCENTLSVGAPAVAFSSDSGRSITSISSFAEVEGPVACGATNARAVVDGGAAGAVAVGSSPGPSAIPSPCADAWVETRALLVPAAPAAHAAVAAAAAAAASASAPTTNHARDASTDDGAPAPRGKSCGCGLVGAPASPDRLFLMAGLFALGAWVTARGRAGSRKASR